MTWISKTSWTEKKIESVNIKLGFSKSACKGVLNLSCLLLQASISTDNTGEYDLASLFSNIIAASKVPLENESEVMKWATFASNFPRKDAERLATVKDLNEDLAQKSVLLGDGLKPSVADILVFCALHIFVSHLPNENLQSTFTNVARWMDYIQNIEDYPGVFDKIVLNNPEFDFVMQSV